MPRNEWGGYDPDHEEYDPSFQELEDEERIARDIRHELDEITFTIRHPAEDPFTGRRDQFSVADPVGLWARLADLTQEVARIRNHAFQNQLQSEIAQVEREVYRQYIPFIESRIRWYGLTHSPLERAGRHLGPDSEEISSWIAHARDIGQRCVKVEGERLEYHLDLDRLIEMLDRYEREPTIYTFERYEDEIWSALEPYRYAGEHSDVLMIDDPAAATEEDMALERIAGKVFALREIASRMLTSKLRDQCLLRVEVIEDAFKQLRERASAPRELLRLEAAVRDALIEGARGKVITNEQVQSWQRQLDSLTTHEKRTDMARRVLALLKKAERMAAGKVVDDDEERFVDGERSTQWAATILGVSADASLKEIQHAYWQLGKKYHPDFRKHGESEADERMKLINDAYSLLRRKHVKLK